MLKRILLSVFSAAVVLGAMFSLYCVIALHSAQTCHAGTLDFGMRAGISHTSDVDENEYYMSASATDFGGSVYVEYADKCFDVGFGYNMFSSVKFDEKNANRSDSVRIHGPEVYSKVHYDFDNIRPYAKTGIMYAFTDGSGNIKDSESVSPVVGCGVDVSVTDDFSVRFGYDHYFDIHDDNGLEADIDYFYSGMHIKF